MAELTKEKFLAGANFRHRDDSQMKYHYSGGSMHQHNYSKYNVSYLMKVALKEIDVIMNYEGKEQDKFFTLKIVLMGIVSYHHIYYENFIIDED